MYQLKNFFRSLSRIIAWIPVLWKIREWDDSYTMDVFAFQFKRTVDHIEKHQYFEGYQNTVRRGRMILRLIDKVQNEEYALAAFNFDGESYDTETIYSSQSWKTLYEACEARQARAEKLMWALIQHNLKYFWC